MRAAAHRCRQGAVDGCAYRRSHLSIGRGRFRETRNSTHSSSTSSSSSERQTAHLHPAVRTALAIIKPVVQKHKTGHAPSHTWRSEALRCKDHPAVSVLSALNPTPYSPSWSREPTATGTSSATETSSHSCSPCAPTNLAKGTHPNTKTRSHKDTNRV